MSQATAVSSPTALPRSSWGETLKRTVLEFKEDKLNHWGGALTYYSVLSLFPALLVLVSLIGLVGNPERVTKVLTDTVSELGPSRPPTPSRRRSSRSPPTAAAPASCSL